MNTPIEETPQDGKQRRMSIATSGSPYRGSGSGGGGGLNLGGVKTRRYSIGIPSSQKSVGEEGNNVPNYLRASTGSCHDFCKYGKKYEHSKSSIPIKFKRTTVVKKEKVTSTVVPVERKKTKTVIKLKPSTDSRIQTPVESNELTKQDVSLPSKKAQVSRQVLSTNGKATDNELKMSLRASSQANPTPVVANPSSAADASAGSNARIKKKDIRTVKKMGMTPTLAAIKKVVAKATPTESQSLQPSFSRAASLKAIKNKNLKQVSPLKDQNRMQKNELKKPIADKVQTKNLRGVEAESIYPPIEIIQSPPPALELIKAPVSKSSPSSSEKNVVEEESTITHPVYESSQFFPDKQLLEESTIAHAVLESSQSSSERELLEESTLIAPVSESSESSYDEEVLEEEFEYTDDEEVESSGNKEVSEEEFDSTDNEEVFASANGDEKGTLIGDERKIARKGRVVNSEDKDDEAVKLRFRRGKVLDLQSESDGPRRLKFRRRVIEGDEDGQSIARRTFRNKTLDLQPEMSGPRRLKFRKGKVMEGDEDRQRVGRRSFEKKYVEEAENCNNGPESVVLKHQGEQGKKDAQGLFNNVIEETASKLVQSRKSKVKALVGAFETVISLQDGKPSST